MGSITRTIQKLVIHTRGEQFFVSLRNHAAVLRRLVPRSMRHRFTSFGKFVPHASDYPENDHHPLTRDNTRFLINRSDYVQWRLFYGVRDHALKEARKAAAAGGCILDVGANFGAFSLRLARHVHDQRLQNVHIHAFEPNAFCIGNFYQNLALNPELHGLVSLHSFGLGSNDEDRTFDFTHRNSGAGRVVNGVGKMPVHLKRLDDFITDLRPGKIAFIKLIAEGFEPRILEGARETIDRFRPPLFIEVTPSWWQEHNASVPMVLETLRGLGYKFLTERHNELVTFQESDLTSFQFNLFAYR